MVVGNKPSKFRTISRVSTSTKATVPSRKSNYQGQDSNLHAFRHQILSLARLPIPPPWPLIFDSRFAIRDCKGYLSTPSPLGGKLRIFQLCLDPYIQS